MSGLTDWLAARQEDAVESSLERYYVVIWRHIAAVRAGVKDEADLLEAGNGLNANQWPYPVIAYFQGQLSSDQLLQAAEGAPGNARAGRICEALVYTGEVNLGTSGNEAAEALFRRALNVCPAVYLERTVADRELQRIVSATASKGQ